MATFLIVHGIEGHPDENWFPWLKKELESRGHTVFVPAFPSPSHPRYEAWMDAIERCQLRTDAILIGHSLGASAVLAWIETHRAWAAYLVSPAVGALDNEFDSRMREFTHRQFDWQAIRANCPLMRIFYGLGDPYIPLATAQNLANNLRTPVTTIENGGHLNSAAGYTTFDYLLQDILALLI